MDKVTHFALLVDASGRPHEMLNFSEWWGLRSWCVQWASRLRMTDKKWFQVIGKEMPLPDEQFAEWIILVETDEYRLWYARTYNVTL